MSLSGQEIAPKSGSSWNAVLVSAGIFAVKPGEEKTDPQTASVLNSATEASSIAASLALAHRSPRLQPLTTAQSSPSTTQVMTPPLDRASIVLPAISKMPRSISMLQEQKSSNPPETSHAAHADHIGKDVNSQLAGKPAAAAILEPADTALPAMASAAVMPEPAKISTQDQFVTSPLAEPGTAGTFSPATLHPIASESNAWKNAVNGTAGIKAADGMKSEPLQSPPLSTSVQSVDASADIVSAKEIHSSASLKSAAPLLTALATLAEPAHPESPRRIAEIIPDPRNAPRQFATFAPASAEPRGTSTTGDPERQTAPPGGRTNALSAVAKNATHSESQASLSMLGAIRPLADQGCGWHPGRARCSRKDRFRIRLAAGQHRCIERARNFRLSRWSDPGNCTQLDSCRRARGRGGVSGSGAWMGRSPCPGRHQWRARLTGARVRICGANTRRPPRRLERLSRGTSHHGSDTDPVSPGEPLEWAWFGAGKQPECRTGKQYGRTLWSTHGFKP